MAPLPDSGYAPEGYSASISAARWRSTASLRTFNVGVISPLSSLKGPSEECEALDLLDTPLPIGQALQALLDGRVVQPWHSSSARANVIIRHPGVGENNRSASRQPPSHSAGGYPQGDIIGT